MIDKRDILDTASALGLTPHVVEKDYVLGWLLWGVSTHEAIAESWAFKGGTCLKKCFFETYRFSEDLDFTVTEARHLDEDFLRPAFADITQRVYEETGIERWCSSGSTRARPNRQHVSPRLGAHRCNRWLRLEPRTKGRRGCYGMAQSMYGELGSK